MNTALNSGDEEALPTEVLHAILAGKNPVKVWREYRGLAQKELAWKANISLSYLSQIEAGKRKATTKVLTALASVLMVAAEDLAA
jgi:transcriptional regulator with XRE-family HTH domain